MESLLVHPVDMAFVLYTAFVGVASTALMVLAYIEARRYIERTRRTDAQSTLAANALPVSILAPAYNEAATIVESVRSHMAIRYPTFEVVVVNDGSTDGTLQVLIETFGLQRTRINYRRRVECAEIRGVFRNPALPGLTVVDKVNGGKADALNAGLNVAGYPLVCSIDADTVVDRDALLKIVMPFMDDPERTVAAGGTIRAANGCTVHNGAVTRVGLPARLLPLIQVVEYLRAFLFGRLGWNSLGGNLIISGAFGLFRKDAVIAVGGYRCDTVGEDMELVVRLHRHFREARKPYRVVFVPTPVCYTEVPETTRTLSRQRDRWQRGLADTLWRHRAMLLSPRYGMTGMIAMPYFLLVELLGPVIELCGLVIVAGHAAFGLVDVEFMAIYLAMSFFFGTFQSCAAILLDELTFSIYRSHGSMWRLFAAAFIENLGYRQLTLFFRVHGMIRHARGARSWGTMERTGFGPVAAAS